METTQFPRFQFGFVSIAAGKALEALLLNLEMCRRDRARYFEQCLECRQLICASGTRMGGLEMGWLEMGWLDWNTGYEQLYSICTVSLGDISFFWGGRGR